MQMTIQSSDFSLTQALEAFIREQGQKSMRVCADRIEHINVRLRDLNGPKGGNDKECLVEVKLANTPLIVVKKRSTDAYASVRKALGRAARSTLRRLGKRRERFASDSKFTPARRSRQSRRLEMQQSDTTPLTIIEEL